MQVSAVTLPSEFQLELCELQSDQFLLSKKAGKTRKRLEVCFTEKVSDFKECCFEVVFYVWKYIHLRMCIFSNEQYQNEKSKPTREQYFGFTRLSLHD